MDMRVPASQAAAPAPGDCAPPHSAKATDHKALRAGTAALDKIKKMDLKGHKHLLRSAVHKSTAVLKQCSGDLEGHFRDQYYAEIISELHSFSATLDDAAQRRQVTAYAEQLSLAYEADLHAMESPAAFEHLFQDMLDHLPVGCEQPLFGGSVLHATIYAISKNADGTYDFKIIDTDIGSGDALLDSQGRGVERLYRGLTRQQMDALGHSLPGIRRSRSTNPTALLQEGALRGLPWQPGRSFERQQGGVCVAKSLSAYTRGKLIVAHAAGEGQRALHRQFKLFSLNQSIERLETAQRRRGLAPAAPNPPPPATAATPEQLKSALAQRAAYASSLIHGLLGRATAARTLPLPPLHYSFIVHCAHRLHTAGDRQNDEPDTELQRALLPYRTAGLRERLAAAHATVKPPAAPPHRAGG